MSQTADIIKHLETYGHITSMEAIELYGATRLSGIIFVLRKRGMDIDTEDITTTNRHGRKTTYGKYVLKRKPEQLRLF